jgi:hypothetical protein
VAAALFLLLLLAATVLGIILPLFDQRRAPSARERAVAMRLTLFSWLMGLLLAGGLVLLPNKSRVLMLAPIFAIAVITGRVWKNARRRARLAVDIERMKRLN